MTKLTCRNCKKQITGAKAVIEGSYWCPRCVYERDMPDREIVEPKRHRARPLQKETLFTPPPKVSKEQRVRNLD